MLRLPDPARVPVVELVWPHACRLLPARFRASECFERILGPELSGQADLAETLAQLAELTAAGGGGDLRLMDPGQVLFGAGAGWINATFALPRPARFSTARQGAFYAGSDIGTCLAEVRHHLERRYRQEGVTETLDLDYRALALRVQGPLRELRGHSRTRAPWSAVYDPESYAASQVFATQLRTAGAQGLVYDSVRHPGGTCVAIFDPNLLRACRHDTYLALRWDGQFVSRVFEKRLLALR